VFDATLIFAAKDLCRSDTAAGTASLDPIAEERILAIVVVKTLCALASVLVAPLAGGTGGDARHAHPGDAALAAVAEIAVGALGIIPATSLRGGTAGEVGSDQNGQQQPRSTACEYRREYRRPSHGVLTSAQSLQ
jgi:hypothetical protein